MDKNNTGFFCHSCNKNVIDFTQKTDADIADFYAKKENENTCGKFLERQLNTDYTHFTYTANKTKNYAASLLLGGLLLAKNADAQTINLHKQADTTINAQQNKQLTKTGEIAFVETKLILKGKLIDAIDGKPVLGAIRVRDNRGVFAEIDVPIQKNGTFEIKLNENLYKVGFFLIFYTQKNGDIKYKTNVLPVVSLKKNKENTIKAIRYTQAELDNMAREKSIKGGPRIHRK